jgi:hypothetical protein
VHFSALSQVPFSASCSMSVISASFVSLCIVLGDTQQRIQGQDKFGIQDQFVFVAV